MATDEELREAEASLSSLEYERNCLQQDLSDVQHDLSQWQERAYEAEVMLEDARIKIADLNDNYSELSENYHDLEVEHDRRAYERDCYRAVLEGMEFQEIDSYSEKGHEFCHRLGTEAKEVTQNIMARLLEKK